jgi:pimeloyl-ACP methyl ester carboxylesterase
MIKERVSMIERMAAAGAGLLRKAIPARGSRRYAVGAIVLALAATGTVTAIGALPAQAAHVRTAQTAAPAKDNACMAPPSPALAGFKQGTVAVSGDTAIHYVIGGSGPVLVLIHGWPITWWEFHTVMPSLSKSFTVIAFDLPGLGNSAPSTSGYGAADVATIFHEAIGALGYWSQGISLLGHDLGTNVAYAWARLYPAEVSREMVLESALNGYGLESLYNKSFHFLFNMQPSTVTEGIVNDRKSSDAYLSYLYSFAVKPDAITEQDRDVWNGDYACPANREAGYNYYRASAQDATFDTTTNTSKLTVEVGAMGGDHSFGGFVAQSFDNVDSNVHTIIAPGSGHYIPEEDPVFLSTCATLFFSPNPPATAPAGYESCLP